MNRKVSAKAMLSVLFATGSETEDIYNGAIEASATLLGSLIVFAVNYIKVDWEKAGDASVILVSLLSAGLLIGMSQAENIWICYISE